MLENIKKRLKSKTYRYNIILGIIGILEVNFHLLSEVLGKHYGYSFLVVMIVGFLLREVTIKPIEDK